MKYSRMLFLSKYYTLIANILPKMEHSVKRMLKNSKFFKPLFQSVKFTLTFLSLSLTFLNFPFFSQSSKNPIHIFFSFSWLSLPFFPY